jgi:hypothetical protein
MKPRLATYIITGKTWGYYYKQWQRNRVKNQ